MAKQVVIIGGGVIGLCAAYYCARRGFRVTIIERSSADAEGCSYGNAGMVVPSHFVPLAAPGMVMLGLKWMWNPASPFYIKPRLKADLFDWGIKFWRAAKPGPVQRAAPVLRDLHLASRDCFDELSEATGAAFGLAKKGLLMLCKSEHGLEEEAKNAAEARKLGVPAEVLTPNEIAALEPGVRMEVIGGVFFPKDCHLSPHRFMAVLKNQLGSLGVDFLWNTEVTGWKLNGPVVEALETGNALCPGDEFILCAGSWSGVLAEELQLRIPLQAGKGYSLTLPHPPQLPEICAIFMEARVAVTPMGGALRFGGTMEMAGLNEEINPVRVQGIINSVPKYYPDFSPENFDGIQPWRGLRPCSPDGLPYLGRTRHYRNLCLATGHSMMGLSLGPITGKLLAQILSGEPPSININLLDPDRYS